jgi:hypothetical protein
MIDAVFTEYKRYLDTELNFEYDVKPGVVLDGIKPLAWYAIRLVGRTIFNKTGLVPVLTSGKRDVSGQLAQMQKMKKEQPELYKKVYAGIIKSRQDISTAPHPQGRAADWRFKGYEAAESVLKEINDWYLEEIKGIIGYVPSPLIVPEKDEAIEDGVKILVPRCLHCQIPPQIPDEQKYKSYLTATFGRV